MRNSAHWAFLTPSLLLGLAQHSSASLPYNAAYLFPSKKSSNSIYLIQSSAPDTYQYELSLIDLSSESASKSLSSKLVSSLLPFVEENLPIAFTPIVDDEGNIYVYAGDCSLGSVGSQIWKLSTGNEDPVSERQWRRQIVDQDEERESGSGTGANFLAAGVHYSPSVTDENATKNSLYIFGGMCPDRNGYGDSWTSGNYSNIMLHFDTAASQDETSKFDLNLISAQGPPVAEAGFSITPLQATYTNVTENFQNKQQDYLLIGGQTESAFINMSQVALFSLPQESWTFLPILQPNEIKDNVQEKDAKAESYVEIEPRSGHSAVLSSDGRRVYIYGGWVGDVETAAQPQLAMVEVGSGYGGAGDWSWTVPQSVGSVLEDAAGIYGHGATVLPDDILMIAGGYIIQPKSLRQKRETLVLNEKLLFFNMSSNTWMENYSPPVSADRSKENADGPLSTASQKIGLGAGLVVASVFLGLILFFFWRRRKYKKSISLREKNIRQLSLETSGSSPSNGETRNFFSNFTSKLRNIIHRDHSSLPTDETSLGSSGIYSTNSQNFMYGNQFHYNFEQPEPLVEIPSPTRLMRKPVPSRFHGMSTNTFYENRPRSNAGYIHPIDEEEEEEEEEEAFPVRKSEEDIDFAVHSGAKKTVTITTPKLHSMLDPNSHQDRSAVARRASIRNHPSHVKRYNGEGQTLNTSHSSSSDVERLSNGRGSPDKSERTISSLSEQSQRSNWSTNSSMREIGGATLRLLTRSVSGGSSALQSSSTDPFITPRSSPTEKRSSGVAPNLKERFAGIYGPASSSVIQSNVPHGETAFATGSGFARLQAEGEALLGGACRLDEMLDDFERINERVAEDNELQLPDTPRKNKIGWIGSVRRALARTTSGASTSRVATFLAGSNNQISNRQLLRDDTFDVPYTDKAVANVPRRAVSDGGFWRGRRGARDWAEDSDIGDLLGRRSGDDWGGPDDLRKRRNSLVPVSVSATNRLDDNTVEGEDWDVEAAVERRVVQVSFTVPKTRLRVVNVDADKGSLISIDERKASEGTRQS